MNGVKFYEHINYQGKVWEFDGDMAFVGWDANDQFSSMKVPSGMTVTLYEHADYGGKSIQVTSDVPDMRSIGWNDFASSVKFGGSGTPKVERLKKGDLFLECNSGGTFTTTSTKGENSKVKVTQHDDKRFDATFVASQKTLSIEPGGQLTARPAGTYGAYEALMAITSPAPDVVNLLARVANGVICGGTVLQIVED